MAQQLHDIESLSESPMLNLSSYSKETFHSDFLYWLSRIDGQRTLTLLEGLVGSSFFSKEKQYKFYREKDHFDFSVWECDGEDKSVVLVLENKLKSIATTAQLDKYAQNGKARYILLSLLRQISGHDISKGPYKKGETTWIVADYLQYAQELEKTFLGENAKLCPYYKMVIEDYCHFIKALGNEAAKWMAKPQTEVDEQLKDLRFDDVRQKFLFSNILNRLHELLRENGYAVLYPASISTIRTTIGQDWEKHKKELRNIEKELQGCEHFPLIFTKTNFSHDHAIVELKFKLKDVSEYVCLIQVQGKDTRVGIEYVGKGVAKKKNDDDVRKGLELVSNMFQLGAFRDKERICTFAPAFFYRKFPGFFDNPDEIPDMMYGLLKTVNRDIISSYEDIKRSNKNNTQAK